MNASSTRLSVGFSGSIANGGLRPIADISNSSSVALMLTEQAFRCIRMAVAAGDGRRVIHSEYDPTAFGNFIIAYEDGGEPRSIVCDRLELAVCDDLQGQRGCRTVLPSIQRAKEGEVLEALGL
jgi:hypothetical protein